MKIWIKWFLTGNVTELDEKDDLLGPHTTVHEVKGFIQIKFGFQVKEVVLIHERLLDNHKTLKEIGIVDQASAAQHVITAHVVRTGATLEKRNSLGGLSGEVAEDEDDDTNDDALQFFSHEDFILASKMLGKDVAVSSERLTQVRAAVPRSRPAFLNAVPQEQQVPQQSKPAEKEQQQQPQQSQQAATSAAPPQAPGYNPKNTRLHQIFARSEYGLRTAEAENTFAVQYPGVAEPYQYWDMRLPENPTHQETYSSINEVCFEMFFFGEFKHLQSQKFIALVERLLQVKLGLKVRCPAPPREAGCMYPLVAVPIVVTEVEGMELGRALFEDFGTALPSTFEKQHQQNGEIAGKPTNVGGMCGQQ